MERGIRAAIVGDNAAKIGRVYGMGRRERLASLVELYPEIVTSANIGEHLGWLEGCEAIFSTWGMPGLPEETIDRLKSLQAVFYAAGSVREFAGPYIDRGITVVSAWAANARPVAAFTLAQILLSCKGYFPNSAACNDPKVRASWWKMSAGPGIFGTKVAIIGAGQIGRLVIELLRPFGAEVLLVDPFLSSERATEMGARLVSFEEAMATAVVVSNHVPNLPATKGMFRREHFAAMTEGATFINTGRGAQVVEEDLAAVAVERPDLTFLLEVTYPEPPGADSPFYTLPNVHLSSHIAGSIGSEVVLMADCVMEELERYLAGEPLRYAVTRAMLETMA